MTKPFQDSVGEEAQTHALGRVTIVDRRYLTSDHSVLKMQGPPMGMDRGIALDILDELGPDGEDEEDERSEPEQLIWRRLQLSKAKLKGVTEIAALMAGFSVVATVELQIQPNTNEFLLSAFVITTAMLVSACLLSIMICTCLLPHIEAIAKVNSISLATQSPHNLLIFYIDLAWVLANTVSIFLFIVDVVLLGWIKFEPIQAICITVIMIPVLLIICIISIIFYWQTLSHQYVISDRKYHELEELNRRISRRDRRVLGRTLSGMSTTSGVSNI